MSNVAVRVEGLGKMYRIGGKQERYRTLRDTLTDAFAAPFKRAGSLLRGQAYGAAGLKEEIWALKDVSFEVKHGEVVGIIGRNGAGKSTLLKILSRITEPTEGYADVYGRVGSLLEVGTGFHPELTGRENIYLNGAILGMSRAEIDRKFDEIVAFAEIEKFIDTPVKHYSSGMGLRLGFAVAAHLEPEILVVDEVLAVGDAQFQKKCLGKMSEVAGEGRTVLFVSHNMGAIGRLCQRTMLLDAGHVGVIGSTDQVVSHYLMHGASSEGERKWNQGIADRGVKDIKIFAVRIKDAKSRRAASLDMREPFQVEVEYEVLQLLHSCGLGIILTTGDGITVLQSFDVDADPSFESRADGHYVSACTIPGNLLSPGAYTLSVFIGIKGVRTLAWLEDIISFHVEATDHNPLERFRKRPMGVISPVLEWAQVRQPH